MIEKLKRVSYNEQIEDFVSRYTKDSEPIEVSFRTLVPELNKPDRATHLIHTYPAKLLMHIPHFFLNNDIFSKKGDLILDPFSGSGTVLLEAILAQRRAIGADANPLARLISKVKVSKYNVKDLEIYNKRIVSYLRSEGKQIIPNVINVDYWFLPDIQIQLSSLFNAINRISNDNIRDFFLVCFSNCVKKVSLADPRVSVPVRLQPDRYNLTHPLYQESKRKLDGLIGINVYDKYQEIVRENIHRFRILGELVNDKFTAKIISEDARSLSKEIGNKRIINKNSVSLIISSPPYAGAQKYIRASSLSLGWLDLIKDIGTLKQLDGLNIGRENYKKIDYKAFKPTGIIEADELLKKIFKINPVRAHIASNYLQEMRTALKEAVRVLKINGYFVLVVGNNQVCGFEFHTQMYLTSIMEELGLKTVLKLIDDIQSYGLMTKRNKTANIITREWVLIFKK